MKNRVWIFPALNMEQTKVFKDLNIKMQKLPTKGKMLTTLGSSRFRVKEIKHIFSMTK
jgi:hypothetical protein